MKKILPLIFALLLGEAALAQKVKLGFKAGITNSYLQEEFNGDKTTTAANTNLLDLGVYADVAMGNLTVQPGLVYFLKGGADNRYYVISNGTTTSFSSITSRLYYLEVPVNVIYNFPIKKAGKIFVGAGPYMAVAVAGSNDNYLTNVNGGNSTTSKNTQPIKFGNDPGEIKRLDFGINGLAGFRFRNGLELGAGIGFGLTDIYNFTNYHAKNVTASFTVGYFFK